MNQPSDKSEKPVPPHRRGPVQGIVRFLRQNRIYWMAPAIIIIVLIGLLMLIAGSSVAPFTYPES